MIIYELEADYANYLASLGAPTRLVRKYAFRNAVLPQITGLALALGAVVAGAIVAEIVFSYPGLGTLTLTAIQNRDYFLIQGIFLFLIVGVLIANFIIDIAYVLIDPRTRDRHAGRRVMAISDRWRGRPTRAGNAARRAAAVTAVVGVGSPLSRRRRARSSSTSRCVTGSSSSGTASSVVPRARIFGPLLTAHTPLEFAGRRQPPSSEYWFGTTTFGQDVFAQFVYGLGAASSSASSAAASPGFGRRRRVHRRLPRRLGRRRPEHAHERRARDPDPRDPDHRRRVPERAQIRDEAVLIGLTSWPWAARAVRAQTFSLASREFVDLARLSGRKHPADHRDARSRPT